MGIEPLETLGFRVPFTENVMARDEGIEPPTGGLEPPIMPLN